ncbi:SHRM1 protein, partial [Crypturellus soui]|nr:SHRM1 protein [Crypturellus soui]
LPKQREGLPRGDAGSERISRQATPLLYYLSGGKSPGPPQHGQHREDARSLPRKSLGSSYCTSAHPTDAQRERHRLPKPHPTHQRAADDPSEAEDVVLGSPGSSLDESFQNDYREQLKVAQKRVLRETSFKRKDLQMSLPVRLRKKPSQRSSIEHLRSFSLSSANEDAKLAPGPPPHLQLVENFGKDEEIRRTQLGRVGGRKRVTKEQKKLCFSEPEKLNELEDKDVPWSRVRDEITEQDTGAAGRKAPETRGRALSSSGISRTELKQIQHTALMEYMERKISQRPGSSQHVPAPAAPAHRRPCYPQRPSGRVPNPNGARRAQNNEVPSQVFPEEEFPEVFAPVASAAPPSLACGC